MREQTPYRCVENAYMSSGFMRFGRTAVHFLQLLASCNWPQAIAWRRKWSRIDLFRSWEID
jgi:hypothetical protein